MDNKEQLIKELNNKRQPCEVFSRVVGYVRPVRQWNYGKQEEFKDRKLFTVKDMTHK